MQLEGITVRPILEQEEIRFNALMQVHHYLGALRPIGDTIRYVVLWRGQWVAHISFPVGVTIHCRIGSLEMVFISVIRLSKYHLGSVPLSSEPRFFVKSTNVLSCYPAW